jgi:chromosome segregation ATPase
MLTKIKTGFFVIISMIILAFALQGCASKGSVRNAVAIGDNNRSSIEDLSEKLDANRKDFEKSLDDLNSQLSEISTQLAELNKQMKSTSRLVAAFEEAQATAKTELKTLNSSVEEKVGTLGDYKTDYDKTWQEINSIGRKFGEAIRELQNLSEANQSGIETTKLELETKTSDLDTKINRLQTSLNERIDTTNKDMNNFRNQVTDHFETIKASYTSFSEAIYAIIKLQYTQFQTVTEEYTRSMNSIEALLPSSTLRTFNPEESLQKEAVDQTEE